MSIEFLNRLLNVQDESLTKTNATVSIRFSGIFEKFYQ